jgi:hypothetical protein
MAASSREVDEKQHVEPQRILEIVTNWKATLNEAERRHMKDCPECTALFVRFMDEQSG